MLREDRGTGPLFYFVFVELCKVVMNMEGKLTAKQKAYCKARAEGKSRPDSWAEAGYSTKYSRDDQNHNAYQMEFRTKSSPLIQAEIKRLQQQAEEGAILRREQRQALLTEIVLDKEEKTDNRLRAADMLNRMSGDYTDKIEQTYSGALALSYEDRRKMLEEGLSD